MKRTLAILCAITVGVAPGSALALCGDLNGDGKLSVSDATLALQYSVGLALPTTASLAVGDLNGDGRINVIDATLILRAVVGLGKLDGLCHDVPSEPTLSTLAGPPSSLVDGDFRSARFQLPSSATVDPAGNLIVADLNNYALRMIDRKGSVSTLVGRGVRGYRDGPVSDTLLGEVWCVRAAADGSIYFSDTGNLRVRKLSADHKTVSTVAGNPDLDSAGLAKPGHRDGAANVAQFSFPVGLAVDAKGNVYVADMTDFTIRKIATDGTVSTVAGKEQHDYADGDALSAAFRGPWGLAFGPDGTLYISDWDNEMIRTLSPSGQVGTLAGNPQTTAGEPLPGFQDGPSKSAQFGAPMGIVFSGDRLYVADADLLFGTPAYTNGRIRGVSSTGDVTTLAGSDGVGLSDGPGANALFAEPIDVARASDGGLFVADSANDVIRRVALTGEVTTAAGRPNFGFADGPAPQSLLNEPSDVAIDQKTGNVYFADTLNNRVRKISPNGQVSEATDRPTNLNGPMGVAVGPDRSIYVADSGNFRIVKIDPSGAVTTVAGAGGSGTKDGPAAQAQFGEPRGLRVGPDGALYVADFVGHSVRRIDMAAGTVKTFAGNGVSGLRDGDAATAQFAQPSGVEVSPKGVVYVTDAFNHNVRRIAAGQVTTLAGLAPLDANHQPQGGYLDGPAASAQFDTPTGLALMPDGSLLVSDQANNRIRKITTDGRVVSVAGIADSGFWDGSVRVARLNRPGGIALAPDGSLVIADLGNDRIRKLMRF